MYIYLPIIESKHVTALSLCKASIIHGPFVNSFPYRNTKKCVKTQQPVPYTTRSIIDRTERSLEMNNVEQEYMNMSYPQLSSWLRH